MIHFQECRTVRFSLVVHCWWTSGPARTRSRNVLQTKIPTCNSVPKGHRHKGIRQVVAPFLGRGENLKIVTCSSEIDNHNCHHSYFDCKWRKKHHIWRTRLEESSNRGSTKTIVEEVINGICGATGCCAFSRWNEQECGCSGGPCQVHGSTQKR